MSAVILTIDGLVQRKLQLTFADLQSLPATMQIPDAGTIVPGRTGGAVTLGGLLEQAGAGPQAAGLKVTCSSDGFAATVPLDEVRDRGLLIYELDGQPLAASQGGPVRFLIPEAAACGMAAVDTCANVKAVDRLELLASPTAEPGASSAVAEKPAAAE